MTDDRTRARAFAELAAVAAQGLERLSDDDLLRLFREHRWAIGRLSSRHTPRDLASLLNAAVLRVRTGHVVVSTDLLVEGRHFRRDWATAADVGHRAAAQNLSDINAMGGRATSLTIGLGAPADLPAQWALDFARGFAEECALVGASVVGGDLTRADQVVIAVTVLGACTQSPVLRSGARPGDVLAITGRQGWSAGGLPQNARGPGGLRPEHHPNHRRACPDLPR